MAGFEFLWVCYAVLDFFGDLWQDLLLRLNSKSGQEMRICENVRKFVAFNLNQSHKLINYKFAL